MKVEQGFQMKPFLECHRYSSDPVLPRLLKRLLPESILRVVETDLIQFSTRVIDLAKYLEDKTYPPSLTQYDQWGRRVDTLHTSEGWRTMKDFAIQEGLVAIPYERTYGEFSRLYGFAKCFLFAGYSDVVLCPLSMTDGAARVMELNGRTRLMTMLTSRNPKEAYTSGQWMTERPGGSDISGTETTAQPLKSGAKSDSTSLGSPYRLDGFKWFSSATDANIALVLGRTGKLEDGSRGLTLFIVPVHMTAPPELAAHIKERNGIRIHRLKNKLGTKILPTAELELKDTVGFQLGPLGQGVKTIAPVLNITRVYSAVASVGALGRCLSIATSYSNVRTVNKNKQLLSDIPLHVATLEKINLIYRGLTHLVFGVVHMLGKLEGGTSTPDDEAVLRLTTPVIKGFVSDIVPHAIEECMVALGGQGYMEENVIPKIIRDVLVEKIWEGTLNVLSIDMIRGASDGVVIRALNKRLQTAISNLPNPVGSYCKEALEGLENAFNTLAASLTPPVYPLISRPALLLCGYVVTGLFLLEHASWSYRLDTDKRVWITDVECFCRWVIETGFGATQQEVTRYLKIHSNPDSERFDLDRALLCQNKL